jgi:hypothetical protein
MITDSGHAPLPAAWAIHWRRTHAQIRNRSRDLELATIVLLLHHSTTHVLLLLLLGTALILLWWRLAVHLLLMHLLLVGIMLHHTWLLLVVHAIWLLLVHHRLRLLLRGHGRRLHWRRRAIGMTHHRLRRGSVLTDGLLEARVACGEEKTQERDTYYCGAGDMGIEFVWASSSTSQSAPCFSLEDTNCPQVDCHTVILAILLMVRHGDTYSTDPRAVKNGQLQKECSKSTRRIVVKNVRVNKKWSHRM